MAGHRLSASIINMYDPERAMRLRENRELRGITEGVLWDQGKGEDAGRLAEYEAEGEDAKMGYKQHGIGNWVHTVKQTTQMARELPGWAGSVGKHLLPPELRALLPIADLGLKTINASDADLPTKESTLTPEQAAKIKDERAFTEWKVQKERIRLMESPHDSEVSPFMKDRKDIWSSTAMVDTRILKARASKDVEGYKEALLAQIENQESNDVSADSESGYYNMRRKEISGITSISDEDAAAAQQEMQGKLSHAKESLGTGSIGSQAAYSASRNFPKKAEDWNKWLYSLKPEDREDQSKMLGEKGAAMAQSRSTVEPVIAAVKGGKLQEFMQGKTPEELQVWANLVKANPAVDRSPVTRDLVKTLETGEMSSLARQPQEAVIRSMDRAFGTGEMERQRSEAIATGKNPYISGPAIMPGAAQQTGNMFMMQQERPTMMQPSEQPPMLLRTPGDERAQMATTMQPQEGAYNWILTPEGGERMALEGEKIRGFKAAGADSLTEQDKEAYQQSIDTVRAISSGKGAPGYYEPDTGVQPSIPSTNAQVAAANPVVESEAARAERLEAEKVRDESYRQAGILAPETGARKTAEIANRDVTTLVTPSAAPDNTAEAITTSMGDFKAGLLDVVKALQDAARSMAEAAPKPGEPAKEVAPAATPGVAIPTGELPGPGKTAPELLPGPGKTAEDVTPRQESGAGVSLSNIESLLGQIVDAVKGIPDGINAKVSTSIDEKITTALGSKKAGQDQIIDGAANAEALLGDLKVRLTNEFVTTEESKTINTKLDSLQADINNITARINEFKDSIKQAADSAGKALEALDRKGGTVA